MPLRAKLVLGITTLVALVLGLVIGLSSHLLSQEYYAAVDRGLKIGATQLVTMVEFDHGRLHLERVEDGHMEAPLSKGSIVRLLSAQGTVLETRGASEVPLRRSDLGTDVTFETLAVEGVEGTSKIRLATAPVVFRGQTVAYLQVGENLADLELILANLNRWLSLIYPASLILSAIGSYFLASQALAPIEKIRAKAEQTDVDQLSRDPLGVFPDDEVGRLARTFEEMLRRLDTSFFRQKRFTADASHELRTPVAIIRGVTEVALGKARSVEEYRVDLNTIKRETETMTRLINDLLFLARSDSDRLDLHLERLDLKDVLSPFEDHLADSDIAVQIEVPQSLFVELDKDRFLQVLFNLLSNVEVHAQATKVTIRGQRSSADEIEIRVTDNGIGVSPEHLEHLTERFYRADRSRGRSNHSTGLGLSIAQEMIEAHGGELIIESSTGRGTSVLLRMPSKQSIKTVRGTL